jgi:hypothetical protein
LTVTVSAALMLGTGVVILCRYAGLRIWHAAVCVIFGFYLASSSLAPGDGAGSGDVPAGLAGRAAREARQAAAVAELLAGLEHQIIAQVLQVVSGPGGAASFLRRQLLGKPLGGPSLPLDVGQP